MTIVTLLFGLLSLRLELGRVVGVFFLALVALFSYASLRAAKLTSSPPIEPVEGVTSYGLGSSIAFTVAGLGMLMGGANLLVSGAVAIATVIGLSDFVIGVTLVAIGTSLPELATSFVAGLRKQADLVVGAIVGSNVFNILGALGASATLGPVTMQSRILRFEVPALLGFTAAMALFLYTGRRLVRWEGALLLGSYAAFIALLFR